MNPSLPDVDEFWRQDAERRVADFSAGKYVPIEGESVFNEICEKYSK